MIDFEKTNNLLLLKYQPEYGDDWVEAKFAKDEDIFLKHTFHLGKDNLYKEASDYTFVLGKLKGDYYQLDADILSLPNKLFMHKDIDFAERHFVVSRHISIFRTIFTVVKEDIYIGGAKESFLPFSEFRKLINQFPTSYELQKYTQARVASILRNYFESTKDAEKIYHQYLDKKILSGNNSILDGLRENEQAKFEVILDRLTSMLDNETTYSEKQWQREILQMLRFLYPKYIAVFENVKIRDTYNNKDRFLDYLLIDANGNVDIVEIKQPFDNCILTKNQYRDNFIPLKELSGTVMQIEKYIFYLNKWGKRGEDQVTEAYSDQLPADFRIKITNPSGIIIMGRDNNLTAPQKDDFEVIKRKYKNVMDIITYDDLVNRLKVMISQLSK
jgi:hypothetical protein